MLKTSQHLILFLIFLSLSHCVTLPPSAQNQNITWEARAAKLSQIHTWNLQGAIGVRTLQDSFSADLNWEQRGQYYTISLFGPLGSSSIILAGQPNQVLLALPDGRKFTARNPETLVAEQLHWRLPVSNLHYWIRGLPVPGLPAQTQFDQYHHIIALTQQGWQIQFLRYSSAEGVDLPAKIFLTNPQLTVKIVISQWKF